MVDVKLQNGDIALDGTGNAIIIGDGDARFQRALVRMTAARGCFIYDRELGTRPLGDDLRRAELALNEALSLCPGARMRLLEKGDRSMTVQLTIDGESREEEVRFYGEV